MIYYFILSAYSWLLRDTGTRGKQGIYSRRRGSVYHFHLWHSTMNIIQGSLTAKHSKPKPPISCCKLYLISRKIEPVLRWATSNVCYIRQRLAELSCVTFNTTFTPRVRICKFKYLVWFSTDLSKPVVLMLFDVAWHCRYRVLLWVGKYVLLWTGLRPQYFITDRSKVVLLLWCLTVTCSCCPYLYLGSPIMWVTYFD